MAHVIFTPIYNEMPWTPFFLRSLLEWDCPIYIGEGAANILVNDNRRSTDGSLQLIKYFAEQWSDRVNLTYFDYDKRTGSDRHGKGIPKWLVKKKVWDSINNGDWIIGLAPDNWYFPSGIKKIRAVMDSAPRASCTLLTGMRVFVFNFRTIVTKQTGGICGPWATMWPCIYRKNAEFVLKPGSELLKHTSTKRTLAGPECQFYPPLSPQILIKKDIIQHHYKGIKTRANRKKRLIQRSSKYVEQFNTMPLPLQSKGHFKIYEGKHHPLLGSHPWRHIEDCRNEKGSWNWQDFTHLLKRG